MTYNTYLKLDELLALQQPLSPAPEHDELLFITIHQVYELWFKQIIHEGGALVALLHADKGARALHTLRRMCTIFKTLVSQVDILETMTPLSFRSFRSLLERASGFQSVQFRELEFLLGQRDVSKIAVHPEGSAARQRLCERLTQPSVYDAFWAYLARAGYDVPRALLERDRTVPPTPCSDAKPVLVDIYRRDAPNMQLCERLVDIDEGFQEWRYRHVKMVERTLGTGHGTGGTTGAEYLKSTLFTPFFPDLWLVRDAF